jgi:hypothetical protein
MATVHDQRAFVEELLQTEPDQIDWDEVADSADSETARVFFEMMCESLDRSVRILEGMVEDNRRFREEFAARSREIEETQARTDAKLRQLLG